MAKDSFKLRRKDPILGLKTPLLFAHRGGAKEAPESTEEAFEHAVRHGADVLELDLRLSRDGELVVRDRRGYQPIKDSQEHVDQVVVVQVDRRESDQARDHDRERAELLEPHRENDGQDGVGNVE